MEAPDYGPEVTAGQLLVCLVMTSSGSIAPPRKSLASSRAVWWRNRTR